MTVCIPDLRAPSRFEPTPVSSHGDDFRLQQRRFQFGDFSGGDFSDHGEFSNMGLKATKRTTVRWDDGMPPPTGRDC